MSTASPAGDANSPNPDPGPPITSTTCHLPGAADLQVVESVVGHLYLGVYDKRMFAVPARLPCRMYDRLCYPHLPLPRTSAVRESSVAPRESRTRRELVEKKPGRRHGPSANY